MEEGNRRMIDKMVILFPQPDSPTIPKEEAGLTEKLMSLMMGMVFLFLVKPTVRSLTSNTFSILTPLDNLNCLWHKLKYELIRIHEFRSEKFKVYLNCKMATKSVI